MKWMISKVTAVDRSPRGKGINIGWMACPNALSLLSMVRSVSCVETIHPCPGIYHQQGLALSMPHEMIQCFTGTDELPLHRCG
jgi:hypothetical protein